MLTKANLCVESWADACDDNHNDIPLLMVKQMLQRIFNRKWRITEDIPVCCRNPGFDNWITYLYHACSLKSLSNCALQVLKRKRDSIKAGALSSALIGTAVTSLIIVGIENSRSTNWSIPWN